MWTFVRTARFARVPHVGGSASRAPPAALRAPATRGLPPVPPTSEPSTFTSTPSVRSALRTAGPDARALAAGRAQVVRELHERGPVQAGRARPPEAGHREGAVRRAVEVPALVPDVGRDLRRDRQD